MEKRTGDIGDPAQWKVCGIANGNETAPLLVLRLKAEPKKTISFSIAPLPDGISDDDALALRKHMNDKCSSCGFEPYRPRATGLSSEVVEGVRQGKAEAWRELLDKYGDGFTKNATILLDFLRNSFRHPVQGYR